MSLVPRLYLRERWGILAGAVAALGPRHAARFFALKRAARRAAPSGALATLHPAGAAHPLLLRRGSADALVFQQIFVQREYACLDGLRGVETVIDLGADAGYSAAWCLSRFPAARVLAVEPDADNFTLLSRNVAPYGDRALPLRAGVWTHSAGLKMEETAYRGGGEWARQVREARPGETADVPGLDLPALIDQTGAERISLLKMDVEGAEAAIFAGSCDWLERVDALAVELHDDSAFGNATAAFERAISGRGFTVSRCGELTVCLRSAP
ncbi:MAG: FkbM family methyltransferase [Gemmatimonadetes bacterium]|nr:FkbM family methyltransferase [Gemmatimonadota bacterium]